MKKRNPVVYRIGPKGMYIAGRTIHYNLHRCGVDELAVGQLINGELPAEDEKRRRIVDAPRFHITKLLETGLFNTSALCQKH